MEQLLQELIEAADIIPYATTAKDRQAAEEKLLKLRSYPLPYDLCTTILTQSNNDYLLFEVGRCLSTAVVKEWDVVFCTDGKENTKTIQLLNFILNWAENRGFECSAGVRQRVLATAGALVRRSAATRATDSVANWRLTDPTGSGTSSCFLSHVLMTRPSDPGPPSTLVIRLIEHIENLLLPILKSNTSDGQESILKSCFLGLCILSALLDEFSYCEDSTDLDMPFETHIFMCSRFQDFELLRLFQNLLCVADRLLQFWPNKFNLLTNAQCEIIAKLVGCLEKIMNWPFLPRDLGCLFSIRAFSQMPSEFQLGPSWASVVGYDNYSRTLHLFIKLHNWLRESEKLGVITLSNLSRLSTLNGIVLDSDNLLDGTQQSSTSTSSFIGQLKDLSCRWHFLIFMEHLSSWITENPEHHQQQQQMTVKNNFNNKHQTRNKLLFDELSIDQQNITKQLMNSILQFDSSSTTTMMMMMPSLMTQSLFPYELPLLSELFVMLVVNSSCIIEPVEQILTNHYQQQKQAQIEEYLDGNVDDDDTIAGQTNYQFDTDDTKLRNTFNLAIVILVIMDKFCATLVAFITQCLHFSLAPSRDSDDEKVVHESVESLFSCWTELTDTIPMFKDDSTIVRSGNTYHPHDNDSIPLALTTGQIHNSDQMAEQINRLLIIFCKSLRSHQIKLFETYLTCKLATPVGLRRPFNEDKDCNEEILIDFDEDDLTTSEGSLYTIGLCALTNPEESIRTLTQLLNEHIQCMISMRLANSDDSRLVAIMEDVHWLLLIIGNVLLTGPASLDSVLRAGGSSLWDAQFSIDPCLLKLYNNHPIDIVNSRRLLLASIDRQQNMQQQSNWPPDHISYEHVSPIIHLIAVLLRSVWLQTTICMGSGQLLSDMLWVLTRFAMAYLCGVVDQNTIKKFINRSPMLQVLNCNPQESQPPSAHSGSNTQLSTSLSTSYINADGSIDIKLGCIHHLLACVHFALVHHSNDIVVMRSVTKLLSVLSLHSPNPSCSLACPAWYELCTIVCGPQSVQFVWSNISSDILMHLVEACICGSWRIGNHQLSSNTGDNATTSDSLLMELLRSLREQVLCILSNLTVDRLGYDKNLDACVNCTAVLRGLARAVNVAASCTKEEIRDFVSLVWNGLLAPYLHLAADCLILKFHYHSQLREAIIPLFSDVAKYCLIYLISPSSSLTEHHQYMLTKNDGKNKSMNWDKHYLDGNRIASNCFLDWTVLLCKNYVQRLSYDSATENAVLDERITETNLLLTLLTDVLRHEFDLRLGGTVVLSATDCSGCDIPVVNNTDNGDRGSSLNQTDNVVSTVDAVVIGLGYLLSFIDENTLLVPEICSSFYSLASNACELCSQGFMRLTDEQLTCFGKLFRRGIFASKTGHRATTTTTNSTQQPQLNNALGSVDNTILLQCLEITVSITDFFLNQRSMNTMTSGGQLQQALRLIHLMGFNAEFMSDLFKFCVHDGCSSGLTDEVSAAILNLIHISPTDYSNFINQLLQQCAADPIVQARLDDAFTNLAKPTNTEIITTVDKQQQHIWSFNTNKPTRLERLDFETRFRPFLAELRSFSCRF